MARIKVLIAVCTHWRVSCKSTVLSCHMEVQSSDMNDPIVLQLPVNLLSNVAWNLEACFQVADTTNTHLDVK